MVRRAHQRAPVLKHERYTLALALDHHFSLDRSPKPAVTRRAQNAFASDERHRFDAATGAVGKQHRSAFGYAGSAPVTHQIKPHCLERLEQTRALQIARHYPRARREARLDPGFGADAATLRIARE